MNKDKGVFIISVGLPARGKSYLFKRLQKFLEFLGYNVQLFNLGDYRRKLSDSNFTANYFAVNNTKGISERQKFAEHAIDDAIEFLEKSESASVALYDGTNTTIERRNWIREKLNNVDVQILWIEMISDDEATIASNIKTSKIQTTDYKKPQNEESAYNDFHKRIEEYQKVYVSCDLNELWNKEKEQLVQIRDFGQVIAKLHFNIQGNTILNTIDVYLDKFYTRLVLIDAWSQESLESQFSSPLYVFLPFTGNDEDCIESLNELSYKHQAVHYYHDKVDLILQIGSNVLVRALVLVSPKLKKYMDEFII